jgi:hypothetical protein
MKEPHLGRWMGWFDTHCASCGGIFDRKALLGRPCPHGTCMKIVTKVDSETWFELLGAAWRGLQGPPWREMGGGWVKIRAWAGEFMHWYEPDCTITGLAELDDCCKQLLQDLLDVGG